MPDHVRDEEEHVRALIAAVLSTGGEVTQYARTLDPSVAVPSDPTLLELGHRAVAARDRMGRWLEDTERSLDAGDGEAVGPALAYLEADPFYFGSGYARCRLAIRLSRAPLTRAARARARDFVVGVVDGRLHCGQPGLGRLAGVVADNGLRRTLRQRLHLPDPGVAHRALHTIVHVRHPGLSPDDVAVARSLVLEDAGRGWYLTPSTDRLARWLWSPDWERDLRRAAGTRGAGRNGAKRLLERRERRTLRPGP